MFHIEKTFKKTMVDEDNKIFGVCSGLSKSFGINVFVVRILFLLIALLAHQYTAVLYVFIVYWIISEWVMDDYNSEYDIESSDYEEDDLDDGEELDNETRDLRRQANALLADADENKDNRMTVQEMQAPSVTPKSLLARSKSAVEQVQAEVPNA